tara:strand:+ start:232 stop:408 length:177 start_codon:yes stop_codon:yes gene_type:complete
MYLTTLFGFSFEVPHQFEEEYESYFKDLIEENTYETIYYYEEEGCLGNGRGNQNNNIF